MQDDEELSSSYSYSEEESFSGQSEEPAQVKIYTKDYKLHEFTFSTVDRALPDVPLPRDYKLSDEQFWVNGKPNVEAIKEHLAFEGSRVKCGPNLTRRSPQKRTRYCTDRSSGCTLLC